MNRRNFVRNAAAAGFAMAVSRAYPQVKPSRPGGPFIKLSCNVYSFNSPLTKGEMSLDQVLEFCAQLNFPAIDPTGYYFPNYPKIPPDEYVFHLKRKAHILGLDISGTGIRTDFTDADPARRQSDIMMAEAWTACAARLGAPVMRVFAGKGVPEGHTRAEVTEWVVGAIRRCADQGRKHGVMMALQNHADFIQTADDDLTLLKMIGSDWVGANLDIGSFRSGDSYEQIARVAPYAITWQLKENLYVNGKETKTDLRRIAAILKEADYRGYVQLETLGAGDPKVKVPRFLDEVRTAIS